MRRIPFGKGVAVNTVQIRYGFRVVAPIGFMPIIIEVRR